ncbi:MAG: hypothetical protein IJ416_01945 [Ruminiclostridium sp.]|nr:hypothetical protein [Ruminiclostridium sp.]
MDKKKGILGFLSQVFMLFGIIVLLMSIFAIVFGDDAKEVSTIFTLGSKGISIGTLLQFLSVVAIICTLRFVFMTDTIIKKMPVALRIILMFASVVAVIVVFVFAFGWFPVTEIRAWVMFILCFIVSCVVSTFVSVLSEKQENKKLEEALKRFKEEQ